MIPIMTSLTCSRMSIPNFLTLNIQNFYALKGVFFWTFLEYYSGSGNFGVESGLSSVALGGQHWGDQRSLSDPPEKGVGISYFPIHPPSPGSCIRFGPNWNNLLRRMTARTALRPLVCGVWGMCPYDEPTIGATNG